MQRCGISELILDLSGSRFNTKHELSTSKLYKKTNRLYKEDKMSGNANVDTPKVMTKTELDDEFIREFDRMIQEIRDFMKDYNERRRLRGLR